MIKILQVGMGHNPGGIESFVLNYHRNIDNKNFKFDYVDIYGNGLAFQEEIQQLGGKIYTLPNYKKHPFKMKKQLEKILRENHYDIVHLNMLSAANMIPVTVACRLMKKGVVVHCHNSDVPPGLVRKVLNQVNMRKLRNMPVEKWACGVQAGKWMWGQDFNQDNVIPNAIDVGKFGFSQLKRNELRKNCGFSDKDIVIGFVGRFSYQKNVLMLPHILSELKKISSNYKMLLIGAGDLQDDLEKGFAHYHLGKDVYFTGVVSEPAPYYSAMDAFILPSIFEGLGMVVVEAQAAGLKCFVSNGVPKAADVTQSIQFIELEKSTEQWAKIIHECIKNKQESKLSFPESYDIKIQSKSLEKKYESLLK